MASHTRLVMNTVIRTYLRSLTQIGNDGTKHEQFVANSYHERISFSFFNEPPLDIRKGRLPFRDYVTITATHSFRE